MPKAKKINLKDTSAGELGAKAGRGLANVVAFFASSTVLLKGLVWGASPIVSLPLSWSGSAQLSFGIIFAYLFYTLISTLFSQ